jgi:hypothetical protein
MLIWDSLLTLSSKALAKGKMLHSVGLMILACLLLLAAQAGAASCSVNTPGTLAKVGGCPSVCKQAAVLHVRS